MRYLHEQKFKVIALRDLAKYVDLEKTLTDPFAIVEQRKKVLKDSATEKPSP